MCFRGVGSLGIVYKGMIGYWTGIHIATRTDLCPWHSIITEYIKYWLHVCLTFSDCMYVCLEPFLTACMYALKLFWLLVCMEPFCLHSHWLIDITIFKFSLCTILSRLQTNSILRLLAYLSMLAIGDWDQGHSIRIYLIHTCRIAPHFNALFSVIYFTQWRFQHIDQQMGIGLRLNASKSWV